MELATQDQFYSYASPPTEFINLYSSSNYHLSRHHQHQEQIAALKSLAGMMDLPPETRLKIYRYLFNHRDENSLPAQTDWVKVDFRSARVLVKPHVWPMFLVCKQIYAEIMPEYYSSTEFHFVALAHLRKTLASQDLFRNYARYIVLNPNFMFPELDELLSMSNLRNFVISNIMCNEPFGTPRGAALHFDTLKRVSDSYASQLTSNNSVSMAMQLRDQMAENPEVKRRGIHLLLRFRYTYIEKAQHPDGWGGKSAKRHRVISYDLTDDVFILQKPDPGEKALITSLG